MPDIYEYNGYKFFFYSNDHTPKHVHVEKAEKLMVVELEDYSGTTFVKFKKKGNCRVFSGKEKGDIHRFINKYHSEILKKWDRFFIEGKKPKFDKINIKLKKETILYKLFGV